MVEGKRIGGGGSSFSVLTCVRGCSVYSHRNKHVRIQHKNAKVLLHSTIQYAHLALSDTRTQKYFYAIETADTPTCTNVVVCI
jgi:hypothetical protein